MADDENTEGNEGEIEPKGDGAPETDPSKGTVDTKSTDKRISDLQSTADKETARANKLQKQLDAITEATKEPSTEEGEPSKDGDAGTDVILDMARMFAYQQNPKLAQYGIAAADLTGKSPSDIVKTAAELVTRFEKIETQVRNKVLADNGLAPEVDAGKPDVPARDFSKMSKEDFDKIVDATLLNRR